LPAKRCTKFSLSLQGTIIQFTTATQTLISIRTLLYERKYNEATQTIKGCSSSASTCGSSVLGINACLLGEMIDRDGRESSEIKVTSTGGSKLLTLRTDDGYGSLVCRNAIFRLCQFQSWLSYTTVAPPHTARGTYGQLGSPFPPCWQSQQHRYVFSLLQQLVSLYDETNTHKHSSS
jgi:hypothetical protein